MKKKLKSNLFIGVLSGTSADSIDAGLFKIDKKISFLKHKKYREKNNLFICEGKRSILSALLKPQAIYKIYFSKSFVTSWQKFSKT